jgi:hypothetical protein
LSKAQSTLEGAAFFKRRDLIGYRRIFSPLLLKNAAPSRVFAIAKGAILCALSASVFSV